MAVGVKSNWTERPRAREREIQDQTDDHRRQAEKRIDQDDDEPPTPKRKDRQRGTNRQANCRRDCRRNDADRNREPHDPKEVIQYELPRPTTAGGNPPDKQSI
jgi:hypothetical protein